MTLGTVSRDYFTSPIWEASCFAPSNAKENKVTVTEGTGIKKRIIWEREPFMDKNEKKKNLDLHKLPF